MLWLFQTRRLFNVVFSLIFIFSISVSANSYAEGSVDPVTGVISAVDITGALPYAGSAPAGGKSFYLVKGLTAGTRYTISVHSVTQNISLTGYTAASTFSSSCSSNRSALSSESCSLSVKAAGEVYIMVDAYSASADAAFTIEILAPPVNEGSLVAPQDITGMLPYYGSVKADGESYYIVSSLTAGSIYTVNLTDVIYYPTLFGYPHKDYVNPGTFSNLCWSSNSGSENETCQLTANFAGKIYLKITDYTSFWGPGSYFRISVIPTGGSERYFEGYSDAPILLNDQVYHGQSYLYRSNYRYADLLPGQRYEVHVKNFINSAELSVFTDYDEQVGTSCSASSFYTTGADMWCVARANALGQLNFSVRGRDSEGGTSYELQLGTAPVAEGALLSPRSITLPYDGQVDETNSYYVVAGLKPNWVYEVVTTHTTRKLNLWAGADINNLEHGNTGRTNANGELFFKAWTGYLDGAWFSLALGDANNPEGSIESPVDITSGSDLSPHHGQLDDTASYYVVKGLTPGAFYTAHAKGVSNVYPDMDVFADPGYASKLCSDDFIYMEHEAHCLAPANSNGELYVRMINEHNQIEGTQYDLWLAPSLLTTQGTVTAPLDIDVSGVVDAGGSITYQGMVSAFRGKNESFYRVRLTTRDSQGYYRVSLTGLTDNVDLSVANHEDSALDTGFCFSNYPTLLEEHCIIQSQLIKGKVKYADLIIKVTTPIESTSNTYWDGAAFTIKVEPVNAADVRTAEGSKDTATGEMTGHDITGLLPYQGNINYFKPSYYKIGGLNPGDVYEVRVNSSRDTMKMRVFDSNVAVWEACYVRFSTVPVSPRMVSCQAKASSLGELYLMVEDNDAVYTATDILVDIDVKPAAQAEGQATAPLDISGQLPRASQVGGAFNTEGYYTKGAVNSYYKVGGLISSMQYQVLLTNATFNIYQPLSVYQDADMTLATCTGQTYFGAICLSESNQYGELYIHVDAYSDRSQSGGYFDIVVREMPEAEGTIDSPVILGRGLHHGRHTGSPQASYYKLTGLAAHRSQRIAVLSNTVKTELTLYGSADYKYELCSVDTGFGPTGCSAAVNSDGELYIRMKSDESYWEGADAGTFELYIP